jgi:hypothetical protein
MPQTITQPGTSTAFQLDEQAFLSKLPFTAHPTALPGVYNVPAPPDSLDLRTASQSSLIKNGILFSKPAPGGPPAIQAAWDAFLSRKWKAADRIVPIMEVRPGITHIRRPPATSNSPRPDDNDIDPNWAGAGTNTGKWTNIVGTWNVPSVATPPRAQPNPNGWDSASWIGLDGYVNTNDVLQAGIQQHVNSNGSTFYVAWYEWYAPVVPGSPGYVHQTNITNFPVSPGDQIGVAVQYVGSSAGYISMANNTTGKNFAITLAPPPGANFSGASCEWILEGTASDLPSFSPINFTTALACGVNGTTASPGSGDTLNIVAVNSIVPVTATSVAGENLTITFKP